MNDDDIQLQSYQDDLNADDNATDPVMSEEGEDPAKEIGIPRSEFTEGLNEEDFGDHNETDTNDDWRERVEDLEEDDGNDASTGSDR